MSIDGVSEGGQSVAAGRHRPGSRGSDSRQLAPGDRAGVQVKEVDRGVSTLFYRNRHLLVLSVVLILAAGLAATLSLPRLEDPRITNRNVLVVTPYPGASAERVETLVSEVLENALTEITGIGTVESRSRAGASVLAIEMEPAVGPERSARIVAEIRDQVEAARGRLPAGAGKPDVDDKRAPVGFTLLVAVTWEGPGPMQVGILARLAEDLADRLRAVRGTELVRVYGAPQEEILVSVDAAQLAEQGLAPASLARSLAAADAKGPAGVLRGADSEVLVEVQGELSTLGRIAAVPLLQSPRQGLVRVGDVATVERTWREPPDSLAMVDGRRAVLVGARMQGDQQVQGWAADAREAVALFRQEAGRGVGVEPIFEQERYTTEQLSTLVSNLLAGALVVLVVVLLVLGWRLAMVVGLALPLVISLVLFSLQLGGQAIHQMSIYGMIVALGLLIDSAIVMADEVARGKARGLPAIAAVRNAVHHLFWPLLASTLTTVLAFAPIMLLPGSVGDFVGSIGSSVILALVASFAVSMTLVAALSGHFAKVPSAGSKSRFWQQGLQLPSMAQRVRALLAAGLRRPALAIALAAAAPLAGFTAAAFLGNEFFPRVDRDLFEVQLRMHRSAGLAGTVHRAERAEEVIRRQPGVERVFWLAGASFPTVYYNLVMDRDRSPDYAHGIVQASSAAEARELIRPLQAALDRALPGVQAVVRQFGQGPPLQAEVQYRLFGPDSGLLRDLGEQLRLALQAHPQVLHTRATLPRGEPKLWLRPDEDEARLAGVTLGDLGQQLQASLEGMTAGTVVEGEEQLPVRVRLRAGERGDLDAILVLPVLGRDQRWLHLDAIADLQLLPELASITRYDGQRTNIIEGYTVAGALPIDVTRQVLEQARTAGFELPAGFRLELGGAAEQDAEAKGDLLIYAPLLGLLTVFVLVLTFRSARLAMLLLAVAGLSVGLGLLSTWLIRFPISFNTILGTLGLMGLAFNNSIVVLAAIRAEARARAGQVEAMVEAVLSTARHLLATTLTTIGGFLPLLLFVGGDFWPSLAVVLAGGVGGSMVLALVLVPAAYRWIDPEGRSSKQAGSEGAALSADSAWVTQGATS